jgi:hypothetical protein
MRKPNYRFERVDRERAKKAKKEEKLKRQQERAAQRDDGSSEPTANDPPKPLDTECKPRADDDE